MNSLDGFLYGLNLASTWTNLGFALIGCFLGTLVGVLPGIGPLATVSMLMGMTIFLDPLSSMVMLAGIYYGAAYGGSTTAILCNLPGEASAVMSCLDGHQMARRGRAGAALATAALASLFAGCFATAVIAFLGPLLSEYALRFNAPEYFALLLVGIIACVLFSKGSVLKALTMACMGIVLGTIGQDIETGAARLTFGSPLLREGIGTVALSMGLFGLAEIILNLSQSETRQVVGYEIGSMMLTRQEFRDAAPAAVRGTMIGSLFGLLPGGGVTLSTFAAYIVEQRISRHPERLGTGAIEGLAAPEAANNAAAQTSFIPLLTLGIPTSASMALLLGVMIMQGIQPGPEVITKNPQLFWGVIASMLIGNVMLVIINLPLINIWVQLLKVPYQILFPIIIALCCVGAYSAELSSVDLIALSCFTGLGVMLSALGFQLVPLLVGFILGPLAEESLRRSMAIAGGDASVFLTRPVSAAIVGALVLMVIVVALPKFRAKRDLLTD
jgi:TctA family transporter